MSTTATSGRDSSSVARPLGPSVPRCTPNGRRARAASTARSARLRCPRSARCADAASRGPATPLVRVARGASIAGSWTMKVLPAGELSASIVPPCSSTSRRTSVRPMPSPPARRSSCARPARTGRRRAAAAPAGCRRRCRAPRSTRCAPSRRHLDLDRAAGRRVLQRVGEQVVHHLLDARRVGIDPDPAQVCTSSRGRCASPVTSQRWRPRAARARQVDRMARQQHLARDDARHVEQVVHHVRQVARLARDDAARIGGDARLRASTRLSTSTADAIALSGLRSSWPSIARNSSLARLAASASQRARPARARSAPRVRARPASARSCRP